MNKFLQEDGYAIIHNCIEKKLTDEIKTNINGCLIKILNDSGIAEERGDFIENFYRAKNLTTHHAIQVALSKSLATSDLVTKMLLSETLFRELSGLLGPDIEYLTEFEIAINDKNTKDDDYLVKKYHQEFWSGMGIEALQLWIPIHLLPGMGTIEIIKKSHTWGHIPHRNREPIEIPDNHETEIIDVKEGSLAIMSALTLHRTIPNLHDQPRIALPITIRNFYYPNTGNLDLFNFKKISYSFYSRLRRTLGNPHYSPYRTLGQKRTDTF